MFLMPMSAVGFGAFSGVIGYQPAGALMLDGSDYLSRTPASDGNRRTWTQSFWLKRSKVSANQGIGLSALDGSGWGTAFSLPDNGASGLPVSIVQYETSGATSWRFESAAWYRDPTAWMHILFTLDTTQATEGNRASLFVNGQKITAFRGGSATYEDYPSEDFNGSFLNSSSYTHFLFASTNGSNPFNGYIADVIFLDGVVPTLTVDSDNKLTNSEFGEFSDDGIWVPKDPADAGFEDLTSSVSQVPVLSSNTSTGVASASSELTSSYQAWEAFDGVASAGNGWTANTVVSWIKYQFTSAKTITSYTMVGYRNDQTQTPKNWTFQGSNNDSDWTTLDTVTNETSWSSGEKRTFTCDTSGSYTYYRVNISANNGAGSQCAIEELEFLAVETTGWGENGFWLNFADGTRLGKDVSGSTGGVATLNPNDFDSGSSCTLGDSNTSYNRGSSSGGAWRAARATQPMVSGKFYFEIEHDAGNDTFAFIPKDHSLSSFPSTNFIQMGVPEIKDNFGVSVKGSISAFNGGRTKVAVDADTGEVWYGKVGLTGSSGGDYNWHESGAPSTGSNALYSNLPRGLFPSVWLANSSSSGTNGKITLHFEHDNCTESPPSGFGEVNTKHFHPTSMGANNIVVDRPANSTTKEIILHCSLDPNRMGGGTLSQSNRKHTSTANQHDVAGNIGVTGSGKYYFEMFLHDDPASSTGRVGVIPAGSPIGGDSDNSVAGRIYLTYGDYTGRKIWDDGSGSGAVSFATYDDGSPTTNDVIGVLMNLDDEELTFYKNNSTEGVAFDSSSGFVDTKTWLPYFTTNGETRNRTFNFSEDSWKYTPPTGYVPITKTITGVGNYATLNPLAWMAAAPTLSLGNTSLTTSGGGGAVSTIPLPASGKWKVEFTLNLDNSSNCGVYSGDLNKAVVWADSIRAYEAQIDNDGSSAQTGLTNISTGAPNIITMLVNMDADTIQYKLNNSNHGSALTLGTAGNSGWSFFCYDAAGANSWTCNFGVDGFTYTDADYKALATHNLPEPTVTDSSDGFVQVLNTGANIESALATARSGYSTYLEVFKDLDSTTIWQWRFSDDTSNGLDCESTAAKTTFAAPSGSNDFLGWAFNMNAAHGMFTDEVSHTNGSDTNTAHGLGAGLKMAVVKITNTTGAWYWSHPGMTSGYNIEWNQHTNGEQNSTVYAGINDTNVIVKSAAPTGTYRVIAIVEVAGFSSLATMTGNGAADGPFVNMGMKPEFMVTRRHTGGTNIFAYVPQGINPENTMVEFDDPGGTSVIAGAAKDWCANGFKQRTVNADFNVDTVRHFIWSIGQAFALNNRAR